MVVHGEAQNRKRQNADDLSRDEPPTKRIRSTKKHGISPKFPPPEFWDKLSKVWLTRRALRELDRRNNIQPPAPERASFARQHSTYRARFARRGGPDLFELRGYPEPKDVAHTMGSSSSSQSQRRQFTKVTSVSSKGKRSSAYDKNFEQDLIDHGVYLNNRKAKAKNVKEINQQLAQERPSLSPSRFSEGAFEDFQQKNEDVIFESDVMSTVLPIICGNADIPSKQNVSFNRLTSITDGATVNAQPDLYDGARPEDIDKRVREDLSPLIIPTGHPRIPVLPNFSLEAKAPRGGTDVAKRQASYNGAIGTRAMHSLQNYGDSEPVYDENAYTISSTYHDGLLKIFANHVTQPTTPGGRPEYHMTQLDSWGMTGNIDTFRKGIAAFRNARDWAKGQRDTFIEAANAKVRQADTETSSGYNSLTDITEDAREAQPLYEEDDYAASQDINEDPSIYQNQNLQPDWQDEHGELGPHDTAAMQPTIYNKRQRESQSPDSKAPRLKKRVSSAQRAYYSEDRPVLDDHETEVRSWSAPMVKDEDPAAPGHTMEVKVRKISHTFHPDEFVFFNRKNQKVDTKKQDWKEVQYSGSTAWAYYGKKTTYISKKRIG